MNTIVYHSFILTSLLSQYFVAINSALNGFLSKSMIHHVCLVTNSFAFFFHKPGKVFNVTLTKSSVVTKIQSFVILYLKVPL